MVEIRRGVGHRIMSIDKSRFSISDDESNGSSNSILSKCEGKGGDDHYSIVQREMHVLQMSLDQISKGGHKHYMIKEVLEQPQVLIDCMRGRIDPNNGLITIAGMNNLTEVFKKAHRIIICACGTSWHSSLIGEYLIEGTI